MTVLIAILIIVAAAALITKLVSDFVTKRTIPLADEFTMQLNGDVVTEVTTAQLPKKHITNSHWHRHTFERPRRKGK